MIYHNGVKAAMWVCIYQAWCLSASRRCSDKSCPKSGIAPGQWWEGFGGKASIWLGQVNSFTLEISAVLTTAKRNDVYTWLFNMTLTFSDGLHCKTASQHVLPLPLITGFSGANQAGFLQNGEPWKSC